MCNKQVKGDKITIYLIGSCSIAPNMCVIVHLRKFRKQTLGPCLIWCSGILAFLINDSYICHQFIIAKIKILKNSLIQWILNLWTSHLCVRFVFDIVICFAVQ